MNFFASRFLMRLAALAMWLLVLAAPVAWAQGVVTGQAIRHSEAMASVQIARLEVLQDVDARFGFEDVLAGRAGAFVAKQEHMLASRHWGSVVWARITLSASAGAATPSQAVLSVLELPKNYLDHVRLFTPAPQAAVQYLPGWTLQEAGDTLAPSQWAVRGLFPRFTLPTAEQIKAQPGAQQVLYLQLVHNAPYAVPLQVMSAAQAVVLTQQRVLGMGLILGAMLMTMIMVGSLAWLYHDAIYAWYCLYALVAGLACASHSGLAHQLLWPVAGPWPGMAVLVFLMLAVACQLRFCSLAFMQLRNPAWLSRAGLVISILCVINAVAYVLLPDDWIPVYFLSIGLLLISALLAMRLAVSALSSAKNLAKAWSVAFLPLLATVVFGLLEGLGYSGNQEIHYQLPIYAAGIEVIVLGLALQWFARERHGEKEHRRALASTDPLTGFISAEAFRAVLARSWQAAGSADDCAVAYVQVMLDGQANLSTATFERVVRVLRSATRSQDLVGHVNGNTMGIIMPRVAMNEGLDQRLARIIALGLMPDTTDPQSMVLPMRIAAATRNRYTDDALRLHEELCELLASTQSWQRRPIRYLRSKSAGAASRTMVNAQDLEDIWERAQAAQAMADAAAQSKNLSVQR